MKMMKCDPRAFARCPYSKECSDSPEHTSFYKGTECDYFNQQVIHAPLTNADRIRAMSDEELAVFLDDLTCLCVDCNDHDGVNENCPIYKQGCGRYCEPKDLMDWLQQPVKEDT